MEIHLNQSVYPGNWWNNISNKIGEGIIVLDRCRLVFPHQDNVLLLFSENPLFLSLVYVNSL